MNDSETKTIPLPMRAARRVIASMARPHRWLYQRFGGRFMNRKKDSTVLMLTTTGRKSGEPRSVLLIHAKYGDDFIVVGSNWGMDKPPAWLLNLEANAEAKVTIAPNDYAVRAQFPEGDEGERCWNLLVEVVPQLPGVAENANRRLPIIKLVRT
ncbi:MAG: nitroreductase family deazaflavin-dependent oxidoreductase [bacterium]|nr:nitroreductase family deazaflavin-dependent oxidoreductase [bacterium]